MKDFHPKQYWDKRIASVSDYQAIGRVDLPERVNKMRKKRLFSQLDEIYSRRDVDLSKAAVLDAGCGNGIYSRYYAEKRAEVVGIDFSNQAIETIRENGINGEFSVGSINQIPYRTDSFDVVHCFSVLYHIINDDAWEDAVAELCRVLKPGGILTLRVAWQEREQDVAEHVRFRSKGKYKQRLKAAGVTSSSTYPIYDEPWMPTITSKIPHILDLSLLWTENQDQKIVVGEKTRNCD